MTLCSEFWCIGRGRVKVRCDCRYAETDRMNLCCDFVVNDLIGLGCDVSFDVKLVD